MNLPNFMIPASVRRLAADTEQREASDLEARHAALRVEAVELRERAAERVTLTARERARLDGEYQRNQLQLVDLGERRSAFEIREQGWHLEHVDGRLAEIAAELRRGVGQVVIDHGRPKVATDIAG